MVSALSINAFNEISKSDVPLSEVAISQFNSSKITRIEPMPLEPGQKSYIPNFGVMDLPNNRIYGTDEGPGKVVGIDFDRDRQYVSSMGTRGYEDIWLGQRYWSSRS